MEAKAKQDKVLEIKRLTTAIAALRSEMNKYEEQLEDCRWVQPLAGKTLGMCP
jgi:signal transduction protein with GAF and PtsI domain